MTDQTLQYPKGSIITFTSGQYSDFGIEGYVVTVRGCDLPALARAFVAEERARPKRSEWETVGKVSDFPAWLVANGHCMPVDASVVHLGNYDRWEREFGVPEEE